MGISLDDYRMRIGCHGCMTTGLDSKTLNLNQVLLKFVDGPPYEGTRQIITKLIAIILFHFYLTLLNLMFSIHIKGIVSNHTCSHKLYSNALPYHGNNFYRCLLNWATVSILFLSTTSKYPSIRHCIFKNIYWMKVNRGKLSIIQAIPNVMLYYTTVINLMLIILISNLCNKYINLIDKIITVYMLITLPM